MRTHAAGAVLLSMGILLSSCASASQSARVAQRETPFQAAARALGCAGDGNPLEVPLVAQPNEYWCWAASGEMVERFFERDPRQCEIANDHCRLNQLQCAQADCCASPSDCLVPGWPPFERRKIRFKKEAGPLKAADLVKELCENRPVVFSWKELGGGGHIMVAIGFVTVNGKDKVLILDPSPVKKGDRRTMPFAVFETGTFMHWFDFFKLENAQ